MTRIPAEARTVKSRDAAPLHQWFSMLPNVIWREGWLTPHELALYIVLKGIAGEDGECWYTGKDLARMAGISKNTVTAAKRALVEKELIEVEEAPASKGGTAVRHIITIKDIWDLNHAYHKNRPKVGSGYPSQSRVPKKNPIKEEPPEGGNENREFLTHNIF